MRLYVLAFVFLLSAPAVALGSGDASGVSGTPRPAWCQPGWECVPTAVLADATEQIWTLRSELAAARLRARRFGGTVGLGGGVGGVATADFTVKWVPTGGIFVVYGFRW